MEVEQLCRIIEKLIILPEETEWIEFKVNNKKPQEIGEYLSALSNAAALHHQNTAYMVWGIEDETHSVVGTTFKPKQTKTGNEELENWLMRNLNSKINFKIYEFTYQCQDLVLFEIPSATNIPISFQGIEYIRCGSYKKILKK